jgi:hypothetical protein
VTSSLGAGRNHRCAAGALARASCSASPRTGSASFRSAWSSTSSSSAHGSGIGPRKARSSCRAVPLPKVAADHLAAHLARWPAPPRPRRSLPTSGAAPCRRSRSRSPGPGHGARPAWLSGRRLMIFALLRQRPHAIGGLGEGPPTPSGTRLGKDHARRLRPSVPDEEDRTRAAMDAESSDRLTLTKRRHRVPGKPRAGRSEQHWGSQLRHQRMANLAVVAPEANS